MLFGMWRNQRYIIAPKGLLYYYYYYLKKEVMLSLLLLVLFQKSQLLLYGTSVFDHQKRLWFTPNKRSWSPNFFFVLIICFNFFLYK